MAKYKSKANFSRGGKFFSVGTVYDLEKADIKGIEGYFKKVEKKAKKGSK